MVNKGWNHDTLMGMPESDFCFWFSWQLDYEMAVAEARREAAEKASRG